MAAPNPPARPSTPSNPRRNNDRPAPARRPLPHGACNYRDLKDGPKAPTCGCRRFWCCGHDAIEGDAAAQRRAAPSETCVCGHHACFHENSERTQNVSPRAKTGSPATLGNLRLGLDEQTPALLKLFLGLLQLASGSQRLNLGENSTDSVGNRRWSPVVNEVQNSQDGISISQPDKSNANSQVQNNTQTGGQSSGVDTSILPAVPHGCRFTSEELRAFNDIIASSRLHSGGTPGPSNTSKVAPKNPSSTTGLGLTFHPPSRAGSTARQSPTVADSQLPSTTCPSADESERKRSPSRAFMQHVHSMRMQAPPLNVPVNVPFPVAFEDLLQSATEAATPSVTCTPDLGGVTQVVGDVRRTADAIVRNLAGTPQNQAESDIDPLTVPTVRLPNAQTDAHSADSDHSDDSNQRWRADLKNLPGNIHKLIPYLRPLHQHLLTYPQLSTSIQGLAERVEALETTSFSHVPADELQDKFELVDARLIDLENRTEEHDRIHAAMDGEESVRGSDRSRRQEAVNRGCESFMSNQSNRSGSSLPSQTSSALISAALRNHELGTRLTDVEVRLEDLERTAQPSITRPLGVEIVLLPWGRNLRGIWFSPDDSAFRASRATTQASEEWNQTRVPKLSSNPLGESGWNYSAISQWADNTDEWLAPKACGPNSVVYARLQSRGLVRSVSLTSSSARDIRMAICKCFEETLRTVSGLKENSDHSVNDASPPILGLDEPFIPLRKVHKSSQLLYLEPSEMAAPATWTSEFFGGVLMHGKGGQKRLFITTRDSYMQSSKSSIDWTWQKLRELPRFHLKQRDEDGISHVPEADAKENCWTYHSNLDTPSTNSSFASNGGFGPQIDDPAISRGEDYISDILSHQDQEGSQSVNSRPMPPTTPVSLEPARHKRTRTLSMPGPETARSHTSSRRNVASFDNVVHDIQRRTSFGKRRRTRSPSAMPASQPVSSIDYGSHATYGAFGPTPRRSKEPPSPFVDNRSQVTTSTNLDRAGRVRVSKATDAQLAYATPFSGPMRFGSVETNVFGEGDTEPDTNTHDAEEDGDVWEGVGDDEGRHADAMSDINVGAELLVEEFGDDDDEDDQNLIDYDEEDDSEYEEDLSMAEDDD